MRSFSCAQPLCNVASAVVDLYEVASRVAKQCGHTPVPDVGDEELDFTSIGDKGDGALPAACQGDIVSSIARRCLARSVAAGDDTSRS